jgi:hypothetical protein
VGRRYVGRRDDGIPLEPVAVSVYVDDPIWTFGRMKMCHMTADAHDELVAMADRIGVARKWIQYPGTFKEHFDVCKSKRALAVRHGAIELTRDEAVARYRARRDGAKARL